MLAMKLKYVCLLPVLATAFSFAHENAQEKRIEFNREKMGGDFRIVIYSEDDKGVLAPIEEAYQLVDSLVEIFSSYSNDSHLSRLNASKTLVAPPTDLVNLLIRSREAFENSEGYFDISIQSAIDIWNKAAREKRLPSKRKLKKARTSVGFSNAVIRMDSLRLEINSNITLNLGGIAKGYIIDKVYLFLYDQGFEDFLVEAAGDIRVCGSPPESPYWPISVSPDARLGFYVKLKSGQAIATSGSTYRFRQIKGRRYSHIIDPKTLTPVTHNTISTVIADNAVAADYLASTLNIVEDSKLIEAITKKEKNTDFILFSRDGIILKSESFPILEDVK